MSLANLKSRRTDSNESNAEIASRDAVPVYAIFTNEQLAQMVIQKAKTRSGLENISGVGDARVAKYGDAMLELLCKHGGEIETNRESH